MKRKRTEITIEFEELIHATGGRKPLRRAWCQSCAGEVTMLTPETAAAIARVTVRTINRRVEANEIHFLETPEGLLFLCLNSLRAKADEDANDSSGVPKKLLK